MPMAGGRRFSALSVASVPGSDTGSAPEQHGDDSDPGEQRQCDRDARRGFGRIGGRGHVDRSELERHIDILQ
jgi:hypothetical protein